MTTPTSTPRWVLPVIGALVLLLGLALAMAGFQGLPTAVMIAGALMLTVAAIDKIRA